MNDKVMSKCLGNSLRLWKKSKKEPITYRDELSIREKGLIMADPTITKLALQIKDLEKEIVNRIDDLVTGDRNKSQLEKDEEARKYVKEQNEGMVSK